MQVSEGSDTFEFRSPHGMKAAHSRLRTFAGIAVRHLQLTRDSKGVLVAEFHSNDGPFTFTAQDHTEFVDAFYRIAQDRANKTGGNRVTTGRQVPYCLFTDPELARIGLSETEAEAQGLAYRLFKVPMETNLRAHTLSETRGFVKALVEAASDRILGFTAFGVGAGETLAAVQIAMIAGLPYTALRDAVLTHPTLVEGLISLFSSAASASAHNIVETRGA